jgi:hypothetical protein
MTDVLNSSPTLLCKLGSIIAHVEEGSGVDGHPFDLIALAPTPSRSRIQAIARRHGR